MPIEDGFLDLPVNLSDIDFNVLDAEEIVEDTISKMNTNHPGLVTDFNKSQVAMMILNSTAKMSERLSMRSEMLVKNNLISSTRHRPSASKILNTLGYELGRKVAASGGGLASINEAITEDIIIPAKTQIEVVGLDGIPLYYEFYNKNQDESIDWVSDIVIPAGSLNTTDLICIEGQTVLEEFTNTSVLEYPSFLLEEEDVLDHRFDVRVNNIIWERVDQLVFQTSAGRYFEVRYQPNGETIIRFGNGNFGSKPQQGDEISIEYRIGGGTRGIVIANYFNIEVPIFVGVPINDNIGVSFSNASTTTGGADEESIKHASIFGPKYFASRGVETTGEDYTTHANKYSSSTGTVLKAVATHRGRASALGDEVGNFSISGTNNKLSITTLSGTKEVTLQSGVRTAQQIADDITSAGLSHNFKGEVYNLTNRVIVLSIDDDDRNVKLTLNNINDSAYVTLGLGIGRYAQYGSRHVDIYAFAQGPLDANGIITAVPLSQAFKDELRDDLASFDKKCLTDEVEIADPTYKNVDIEAIVYVNKGYDIEEVELKVMTAIYEFFNPLNWNFGQKLNTVDVEKTIYNSTQGIDDIKIVLPQDFITPDSYQLITIGDVSTITFVYVI